MCGIIGAIGISDANALRRMQDAVKHRGPDQSGTYVDQNVMLGHRRLSILDLSNNARQPMTNAEGDVVVVFNGEIYNYRELRRELEQGGYRFETQSDTEVLVHGYKHWKEKLPEKLDGDFAFCAWNNREKKMLLARDPIGVAPLYYAQRQGVTWFASEPKAFFATGAISARLDPEALDQYLTFRYPLGPHTLFKGIYKVQPGSLLSIQNGKTHHRRYFELEFKQTETSENQAVKTVSELFSNAVRKRLQSDVPLGAYLSGGLDSSWIVAQMSHFTRPNTFSVSFNQDDDETKFVEEIVSRYDTQHTELKVEPDRFDLIPTIAWHLDEPPADIAALPTYLMAQQTKKHATVVYTGDGGDEVFAGYSRYQRLLQLEKVRPIGELAVALTKRIWPAASSTRIQEALHSRTRAGEVLAVGAAFSSAEKKENHMQTNHAMRRILQPYFSNQQPFLNQQLSWDMAHLLPDDYLMKVNKSSMAFGVEPRVPFLDTALVRYVATLPVSIKADWRRTKIVQRKTMKKLGVPEMILHRKKHGFNVPTPHWLKSGLKEIAQQAFESLDRRGLFASGVGQKILQRMDQNPAYYGRQFWTLLGLEVWMGIYLDSNQPRPPRGFHF